MHHGINDVERVGRLVICQPKGAFNMDGVKEYEADFAALVTPILGTTWGILNEYLEFETGGPDVINRIRAQYRWCIANGCRYMAFYTTNPLQGFFARKTAEDVGFEEMKLFSDRQEARAWIESKLS